MYHNQHTCANPCMHTKTSAKLQPAQIRDKLQICCNLASDLLKTLFCTDEDQKRTVCYPKIRCSEKLYGKPQKFFPLRGAPSASVVGFSCTRWWLLCLLSTPLAFARLWYHEKKEERKGETSLQAHTHTHRRSYTEIEGWNFFSFFTS